MVSPAESANFQMGKCDCFIAYIIDYEGSLFTSSSSVFGVQLVGCGPHADCRNCLEKAAGHQPLCLRAFPGIDLFHEQHDRQSFENFDRIRLLAR